MIKLPASILEVQGVAVPTEEYFLWQMGGDTVDKDTPWIRTGSANGAMQATDKASINTNRLLNFELP